MTRTERRFFFIFGNTPANRHDTFGDLRNLSISLAYIPDGRLSFSLSLCVCLSRFLCTYHAHSLDGVGFGREATQRARGPFHARLGGHLILVLIFFFSFLVFTSLIPCFFFLRGLFLLLPPRRMRFCSRSRAGAGRIDNHVIPEPQAQIRAPFPFSLSSSREDDLSDNILDRGMAENPVEGVGRDATLVRLHVTYDDSPLSVRIGRLGHFKHQGMPAWEWDTRGPRII